MSKFAKARTFQAILQGISHEPTAAATLAKGLGHLLTGLRWALGRPSKGNLSPYFWRLGIAWGAKDPEVSGSMKLHVAALCLVATLALTAGCGQSSSSSAGPANSAAAGPREIDITANDTMHYDTTAISAKPGEALRVVLTNTGVAPLPGMGHNWVLLKAGSDAAAFATAGASSPSTGYIPASLQDEILAKIDLLGPRKSGEADFNAPTTPGDYPYLCTFPAHYLIGMHGILTVK